VVAPRFFRGAIRRDFTEHKYSIRYEWRALAHNLRAAGRIILSLETDFLGEFFNFNRSFAA